MALLFKWVDTVAGNDGNDGNTESTAYKTLGAALAVAGNYLNVFVKPGVYWLSADVAVANTGGSTYVYGLGRVVIKQPNNYVLIQTQSSSGIFWHNIIFMNNGSELIYAGTGSAHNISYLNNCVVNAPKLVKAVICDGAYAVNVTTPTNVKLNSPASATVLNVFYASGVGVTAGGTAVYQYRCGPESGSYVSGAFVNPSSLFPMLYGAYPILPKRISSLYPTKIYPDNVSTGTVRSTTGSGCYAASPMQPVQVFDDPLETAALRIKELVTTTASCVRYNLDYGSPITAEGVFISNGYAATAVNKGAKDFILQGSNSASAFADTTYVTDTNWSTIGSGTFLQRSAVITARSVQIVPITNVNPYRYYSVKLVNNLGGATNICVNKLLVAAKNTFSPCDLDIYKTGSTGTVFFPASSTGWCNDPDFEGGAVFVDDFGITIAGGTSARAVGPVYEFFAPITIRNIAISGSEEHPSATEIEFRIADTEFHPSSTSPSWTSYSRNSNINASGTYLQYRCTLHTW